MMARREILLPVSYARYQQATMNATELAYRLDVLRLSRAAGCRCGSRHCDRPRPGVL